MVTSGAAVFDRRLGEALDHGQADAESAVWRLRVDADAVVTNDDDEVVCGRSGGQD